VDEQRIVPVWEESKQTRLGQGLYQSHRLRPDAIAQTATAVGAFVTAARGRDSTSVRIIATSAARDAVNAQELTNAIEQTAGLNVEILSGEQEADLVFKGVTTDPSLARVPLLLLDVGGASTEFVLGHGEHQHFRASFPLGSVRLMEKLPHSDPPKPEELAATRLWLKQFLREEVQIKLERAMKREIADTLANQKGARGSESKPSKVLLLIGTGGTATILGRMEAQLEAYDRTRIEATRLTAARVRRHVERLWSLPLGQRKQIIGLPGNRADVILPGAAIYEMIMEEFDFSELRLSTRGLRFAAVIG